MDGGQEPVAQLIGTVRVEAIREDNGLFRELDFEVATVVLRNQHGCRVELLGRERG